MKRFFLRIYLMYLESKIDYDKWDEKLSLKIDRIRNLLNA